MLLYPGLIWRFVVLTRRVDFIEHWIFMSNRLVLATSFICSVTPKLCQLRTDQWYTAWCSLKCYAKRANTKVSRYADVVYIWYFSRIINWWIHCAGFLILIKKSRVTSLMKTELRLNVGRDAIKWYNVLSFI